MKIVFIFAIRIMALLLAYVQSIVFVRYFGIENYGVFTFINSVLAIITIMSCFGLDQLIVREMAKANISENSDGVVRLIKYTIIFSGFNCAIILSLLYVYYHYFYSAENSKIIFVYILFLTPIFVFRRILVAVLQGMSRVSLSIIPVQVVFPSVMILITVYFYIVGRPASLNDILNLTLFASFLSLMVSIYFLKSTKNLKYIFHASSIQNSGFNLMGDLKVGYNMLLATLAFAILQNVDVLMLTLIATPGEAAAAKICSRISELVAFVRVVSMLYYRPLIARAYGDDEINVIRKHVICVEKIFLGLGLPLFIGFWVFSDTILEMYGEQFSGYTPLLRIYLIGVLVTLVLGPATSVLQMTKYESKAVAPLWVAVVINILGNMLLIPYFGVYGAAISNTIALTVFAVLSCVSVFRLLDVHTSALSLIRKF